jgi:hypothetical protein
MQEAALIFLGLIVVAIVNFLGLREINKSLQQLKK